MTQHSESTVTSQSAPEQEETTKQPVLVFVPETPGPFREGPYGYGYYAAPGNPALTWSGTKYTCPACKQEVRTRVKYETGLRTHAMARLMCLLLLWPCVWVPYASKSCKNANHFCPKCQAYIGTALKVSS